MSVTDRLPWQVMILHDLSVLQSDSNRSHLLGGSKKARVGRWQCCTECPICPQDGLPLMALSDRLANSSLQMIESSFLVDVDL